MQLRVMERASTAEWDRLATACGANPLHCPALHRLDRPLEEMYLLSFEDRACALAFAERPGGLRRFLPGQRELILPTAPATANSEAELPQVMDVLLAWAKAEGYGAVQIGASCSPPIPSRASATRFGSIVEFTLDLRGDLDAIRASFHKTHRKNVRRAQRQELRVVEDSSLEGLLRLREMQLSSSERAGGFGVPDPALFERLHEFVYGPGIGHVFFAYEGDQALAALAWVSCYGRVLTVRSGSIGRGYELRAMYLLYDELIGRALGEGAVELNAGGVPLGASDSGHEQSGLYEFKQGFGTTARERHGLRFELK